MSLASCPVSGSVGAKCPVGNSGSMGSRSSSHNRRGPRGCAFSGVAQPGDIHAAFNIPRGVDADEWLRMRERKSINEILYSNYPNKKHIDSVKSQAELDALNANEHDLLAVALGAPARQVMRRAEEIGPQTGWRDGYLSMEHGFCPPDYDEAAGALSRSPGRIWSGLCERMPGCVAQGRVREAVAALPLVEGTEEVIPDQALWAALVSLAMLCSIYRFEEKYDGTEGVSSKKGQKWRPNCPMGDDLCEEVEGIPLSIALPFYQVSRRMGRTLPHLTFPDQSSYNIRVKDATSTYPYVARFDNIDLRWSMFGERAEVAFLKGCAETSASFQHGPDAIAACQEHVMTKNVEGLLRELVRLKEILDRMPNAFHSISPNPNAGENFVSADRWVRWAKFSAPLSKRCPASSGLQFPPYLVMDAFIGRRKYDSFLGAEGVHLRAWMPANLRAFIASIENYYSIPEFVKQSGDPRLMGVFDGIVESYAGERGYLGVHRYKVFGILEIAGKNGRLETNGASGADNAMRPWEETHSQFSEAMKERLEPHRGPQTVEPHQMRGTFEELRYRAKVLSCNSVDNDPERSLAQVTLDIQDTGITFGPGDRVAVMPLNSWEECAKVVAALGLDSHLDSPLNVTGTWARFENHCASVRRTPKQKLTVIDILRQGHLAPITRELAIKVHELLQASSTTALQILAAEEWPVCGSLGDLLQKALTDTPAHIWDKAFSLDDLSWLTDLIELEVPRTYSIASYEDTLLPSTIDLAVSRAESKLNAAFVKDGVVSRAGVSSGFLNPRLALGDFPPSDEILIGVSRPAAFQLPIDNTTPCAYFAGGSGIAPFRSFWQYRLATSGLSGGKNLLYLGVQSREKFCFEEELRELVRLDFMEVHVALSRDPRGLAYDPVAKDLVEKHITPRYIDSLIVEQGNAICDLVMSKKQGGLGGNLYVCGNVSFFESVKDGIRKALYTYRTATMEAADMVLSKAFAERRFMMDIFMSPKPLPCNLPKISLSELALHTGHRPKSRIWIAVHGSVYDITDFCPMHPGGTLILKSNGGSDTTKSFDNLAHTNNPEVSSLLTRYFVGHLTPKPAAYVANSDMSSLYDLWSDYLKTTVETLVAHQFAMNEVMEDPTQDSSSHDPNGNTNIWSREGLPSMIAIRTFYGYQSRLLQGGFASLFGPKMQELVLRLSFAVASSSPNPESTLPDVLGTITRAKTSLDAATCSKEVSLMGELLCDSQSSLRFQQRGVFDYASKSIELDVDFLEDIREEACTGMDAFDSVAMALNSEAENNPEVETVRLAAFSVFLLQTLERMARRLTTFYTQLARISIYRPELEHSPARARWALVRRYIRDGTLFVLTSKAESEALASGQVPSIYMPRGNANQRIDFDKMMSQVNEAINTEKQKYVPKVAQPKTVNEVHQARSNGPSNGAAPGSRVNVGALDGMTAFLETNTKAIRRLSRIPLHNINMEDFLNNDPSHGMNGMDQSLHLNQRGRLMVSNAESHPSSRNSSHASQSLERYSQMSNADLNHRLPSRFRQSSMSRSSSPGSHVGRVVTPYPTIGGPPTPPNEAQLALKAKLLSLNTRPKGNYSQSVHGSANPNSAASVRGRSLSLMENPESRGRTLPHSSVQPLNTLRSFKLRGLSLSEKNNSRITPTF